MSGPRKMTAAEYLQARGWTMDRPPSGFWSDPTRAAIVVPWEGVPVKVAHAEGDAVAIQRARDAEAEREAWVAFAAGALSAVSGAMSEHALCADGLLDAYRARFAVEVES